MKAVLQFLGNTLLPIVIVVLAIVGARKLIEGRTPPARTPIEQLGPLVDVMTAEATDLPVLVEAQGTVTPARQTVLQLEVGGRVASVHPQLQVGGIVPVDAELVRIDNREYRIAADEQRAALDQARTQVDIEAGRQQVAQREWDLFAEELAGRGNEQLALRAPQMRAAEVGVAAAQARLDRARLNLNRTSVRAPFQALVTQATVEPGQLINAQTQIATLVATDVFWVQARVPLDQLDELAIPGFNATVGGPVTIRQRMGDREVTRQGTVLRLLGEVDAQARMARVLVEVPDPLLLGPEADTLRAAGALPLLLSSWVTLRLDAGRSERLVELPRSALRNGHDVWILSPDGSLSIRRVELASGTPTTVRVREGITPGERVITSHIATPVEGMALRLADASVATAEAEGSR